MVKLTPKQIEVAKRIQKAAGRTIRTYYPDGIVNGPANGWFIVRPYSDEDGRVCEGMLKKGALTYVGDKDYALTPAAIAAIK